MSKISRSVSAFLAFGLVAAAAFAAGEASLTPGGLAPALSVKKWYKGTPVANLDPAKTYVVEFWATWCRPCRESIPHLTETAKKNPDVTFIGVSIWEEEQGDNISKFVKEMGDKMNYNVGYSGNQDGMAKTWMAAAGQNGIPAAFIVKGGNIQWVGHPMEIEKPLAEVKAGTFDVKSFKATFDAEAEKNKKQMAAQADLESVTALYDGGKKVEATAKLNDLVTKNPELKSTADFIRFGWDAKDRPDVWLKNATEMAQSKDPKNRQVLLSFALRQTQPDGNRLQGQKALDLVMKSTGGTDMNALLYSNAFYTRTKQYRLALDAVNSILKLQPNSPLKGNEQMRAAMLKAKSDLEGKLQAAH